jgi:ankyrin repeat protein
MSRVTATSIASLIIKKASSKSNDPRVLYSCNVAGAKKRYSELRSKSSKSGALHSVTLLAIQDGWTPIWFASSNGRLEVVQFLLERGANLEAADKVCFTISYPYTS